MSAQEERKYPLPANGHALPKAEWEQVEKDAEKFRAEADESETE